MHKSNEKCDASKFIISTCNIYSVYMSEWVIKFNSIFWTEDIGVHVIISHVIIIYTLESLSRVYDIDWFEIKWQKH